MNLASELRERPEATPSSRELPTGYYLEHFLTLLDTVESRYGDLLCPREQAFLHDFRELPLPAQRLFVRLVSRKGPVFRSDRLSYPEIGNLQEAWVALAGKGFLAVDAREDAPAAGRLLTTSELRDLAGEAGIPIPGGARKAEILERVTSDLLGENLVSRLVHRFHWLNPSYQDVLGVFRLLFFGTPEPDLTAFVLNDLGMTRFETYPLLNTHRLFTTREEIETALRIRALRDDLALVIEESAGDDRASRVEQLTASLPTAGGHPLLTRWRRRFLETVGRFWERQGNPDRALEIYADPETLPSRERRARLLFRQEESEEAIACCLDILNHPRDPEEEEIAVKLLAKRSPRVPFAAEFQPKIEKLILPQATEERIEKRVLDEMIARGMPGFEAENRFWTSLFALTFWEILYKPIPRAFGHPFQFGPTDLFSLEFRPAREEAIRARLAELTSGHSWKDGLLDQYRRKHGIANALIAWDALPMPVLERVLEVLPAPHLAAVCDRLSRNPGGFKTGFPDLFLFSPDEPGYLLAEVKSPNDRLQNNQRSWMRFFGNYGIPCRVIQVEYSTP